jgi:DNA-binding Xre family transcriptional regulator
MNVDARMAWRQENHLDYWMLSRVLIGAMQARGMSETMVAEEIGISASTVSKVLALRSGKPGDIMLGTYIAICGWLNMSLDTFVITGDPVPVPVPGVLVMPAILQEEEEARSDGQS